MITSVCGNCVHAHDRGYDHPKGQACGVDGCDCTMCPIPLRFSDTHAWSPLHIGRAKAIAGASPQVAAFVIDDGDRKGQLSDIDIRANVYGSDLLAHLEMLARRERG